MRLIVVLLQKSDKQLYFVEAGIYDYIFRLLMGVKTKKEE